MPSDGASERRARFGAAARHRLSWRGFTPTLATYTCWLTGTLHGAARWRAAAFVKTRTPPERRAPARAGSREPSFGGCTKGYCYEGSASQTHGRAKSFFYSTSSAFCAASCACSHAAGSVAATPRATTSRPSLMTSQYQRPSWPLGIMRNSTFSIFCWVLRPQGELGHFLPRRTQSTRRRGAPARGPEEKYRPPYPSSRRTACRPGLDHATILPFEAKPLITLTLTLHSKRIDGPVGSALCRRCGVAQKLIPKRASKKALMDLHHTQTPAVLDHSRTLTQGDGVPGQRSHAAR
jgi:hypothetical protein